MGIKPTPFIQFLVTLIPPSQRPSGQGFVSFKTLKPITFQKVCVCLLFPSAWCVILLLKQREATWEHSRGDGLDSATTDAKVPTPQLTLEAGAVGGLPLPSLATYWGKN